MDAAYGGHTALLRGKISDHRINYVQHWALLTSTDRLKYRMTAEGYPGHFANSIPVPPDPEIRVRFQQWAATVNAEAAFSEFDQFRTNATAAPPGQAYRSHVWAWKFFADVVYLGPHGLNSIKPKSQLDWMIDLAEFSPHVPMDIAAILQPLLA
jgi:hypothetical protein